MKTKTTEARQNFTTYVRVKEQLERRKKRLNYRLKLTGEFSKKIVLQTEKLDSKAQWFFLKNFRKTLIFLRNEREFYVVDIIHFDIYEVGDIVIAILVEICRKYKKELSVFVSMTNCASRIFCYASLRSRPKNLKT